MTAPATGASSAINDEAVLKVHVLDTSALNDLVAPSAALVRHRLLTEIDAGRIVVLATDPLTWELAGTRAVDEPKYVAMAEMLLRVTSGRAMLSAPVRRERELRAGRALVFPEFVDDERQFVPVFAADVVDREAAYRAGLARGLRFAEAEKAADAVLALDEEERRQRGIQGQPVEDVGTAWRKALKLCGSHSAFCPWSATAARNIAATSVRKPSPWQG